MKFWQVDSFTSRIFSGNPAAVFVLSDWFEDKTLMSIAEEMNLSETAFLVKNGERWQLRWFTPNSEVDLCGHATLAAAHILWEQQFLDKREIEFFTKSGTLLAFKEEGKIGLDFPLQPAVPCEVNEPIRNIIEGIPAVYIGSNSNDLLIELSTEAEVKSFKPNLVEMCKLPERGCIITARSDSQNRDYVYRAFFPKLNILEDPVTGSANTLLGPYWSSKLEKNNLQAEQLSKRGGSLTVSLHGNRVKILGSAVTVFEGNFRI